MSKEVAIQDAVVILAVVAGHRDIAKGTETGEITEINGIQTIDGTIEIIMIENKDQVTEDKYHMAEEMAIDLRREIEFLVIEI